MSQLINSIGAPTIYGGDVFGFWDEVFVSMLKLKACLNCDLNLK